MKTCLHRMVGECRNCSEDYNTNHHPNNLDCKRYYEVNIYVHSQEGNYCKQIDRMERHSSRSKGRELFAGNRNSHELEPALSDTYTLAKREGDMTTERVPLFQGCNFLQRPQTL